MALKFSTGKRAAPIWVHLYGVEGIGKSTFASEAPDPVFIDVEQGTNDIPTNRVTFDEAGERTRPSTFAEFLTKLCELRDSPHPFRTIVIDTADALEALVWSEVCRRAQVRTIEDVGGGYGKGYSAALTEWRQVVDVIEGLMLKGYNVITLGHCIVKKFANPDGEDFDRYIPKLNEKAASLIKERAGAVLFSNYRIATRKTGQRVRGVTDKTRLLYTERTAAWDAKNRYSLPEQMALSWASFFAAVQAHKPADPSALRAAIAEKIASFPDALKKEAAGYLEQAAGDALKLSRLNSWVNAQNVDPDAPEVGKTEAAPAASEPGRTPLGDLPAAAPAAAPTPEPTPRKLDTIDARPTATEAAVTAMVEDEKIRAHNLGEDKTLQPGVDPVSMTTPASAKEQTPKAKAYDAIEEALNAAKTGADLVDRALPLIRQAIERKTFTDKEIEQIRTAYTDLDAKFRKAAKA